MLYCIVLRKIFKTFHRNFLKETCKQTPFFYRLAGLPEVNPFKTTTVTSATFCSFDCTANEPSCKSYVYLKSKALDNCLLSRDLNGESSSEDSETYASQIQQPSADEVRYLKIAFKSTILAKL